jgi:hypothetical protein
VIEWARSGSLCLDDDGHLYSDYRKGYQWHGPVEDAVPPVGMEADLADLLKQWEGRFNPRDEALWAYRLSVGG